ncbi:MAG: hypothetical protein V1912_07065 [bacterium]
MRGFGGWMWGWSAPAAVGGIILLGIILIPWFLFLLNLQTTLNRVSDRNRAMPSGHVWLNFIPIFNLGWFIYTVTKVRDSVKAEYQSRGWTPDGDFGYNVGLTAGILAIASFFIGWVPVLGWGIAIALLVCWIIYWLKTSDLKNRLGQGSGWQGSTPYPPYPPYPGSPGSAPGAGPGATPPYSASRTYQTPPPAAGPSFSETPVAGAPTAQGPPGAPPEDESADQRPPDREPGARLCAGCGTPFDPGDGFCRTCGLRLP